MPESLRISAVWIRSQLGLHLASETDLFCWLVDDWSHSPGWLSVWLIPLGLASGGALLHFFKHKSPPNSQKDVKGETPHSSCTLCRLFFFFWKGGCHFSLRQWYSLSKCSVLMSVNLPQGMSICHWLLGCQLTRMFACLSAFLHSSSSHQSLSSSVCPCLLLFAAFLFVCEGLYSFKPF